MKTKLISALAITLLAAAAIAGLVSANGSTGETDNIHRPVTLGQVVHIGTEGFTIERQNGAQVEVLVTDRTHFRAAHSDSQPGFDDLILGLWVAVAGRTAAGGEINALLVVLLPEDFNPEDINLSQYLGEVTQINNGQQTFTITTRGEEELTFSVGESTRFLNGLSDFQELERGMPVYVMAIEREVGSRFARLVALAERNPAPASNRVIGTLSDFTENSLSLQLRGGNMQTFTLTEETAFRSLDGSAEGLSDLESGHVLVVVFQESENGGFTAQAIIATGEALNRAIRNLERAAGEVQSAGGSHLTIRSRSGETIHFEVGEHVRIRGRNGAMELNDLKNGMRVVVLYTVGEDGDLYARVILVGADSSPGQTPE
jgi:hypothetical protein